MQRTTFAGGLLLAIFLIAVFAWWWLDRAVPADAEPAPRAIADTRPIVDAQVRVYDASSAPSIACGNAFVPSTPGASRTYEIWVASQVVVASLVLVATHADDTDVTVDWAIETRYDGQTLATSTRTTRCSPDALAEAPWANLPETLSGIRWEGRLFAIPAHAAPGDQWESNAVWRTTDGVMREVRHARATGREACATPIGTRDCLRYEVDVTLSDESPLPDRVATTHARGVEWVTEGIGLVRSELDDGSHLGPRITLTALRDP